MKKMLCILKNDSGVWEEVTVLGAVACAKMEQTKDAEKSFFSIHSVHLGETTRRDPVHGCSLQLKNRVTKCGRQI